MARRESDAETPYLQVDLDLDPLQADLQLQETLLLDDSHSDLNLSHKRKHSRVSSSVSCTTGSDDVSGRFDDAEESESDQLACDDDAHDARSVHSSKRRRSNDWPLRDGMAYNEHGLRVRSGKHRSMNSRGSPRSSAAVSNDRANSSPGNRIRRSRFIEGSMNDRVSEKPPSIFLRGDLMMEGKETANNAPGQRQSGIFKFGKAIAAAFNPFGVWENVSDIWKPPQERPKTQKEIMKERQTQAQKAYAELKKSGYKGTKGNYTQTNGIDPDIADQTWKVIQAKMEYQTPGRHSRHTSASFSTRDGYQSAFTDNKEIAPAPGRQDLGSSLKSSFQDLRKARSALSIPSIKRRDGSPTRRSLDRPSEDSQRPYIHKQQSRKDLAKHAKLLKKVSNLEDKLERARRELREVAEPPVPPVPSAVPYNRLPVRKFVPGALPSLPSERLLKNHIESASEAESAPESVKARRALRLVEESNESEHDDAHVKKLFSTPKPRKLSKEQKRPSAEDTPSLKRKSPDVGRKQSNNNQLEDSYEDQGWETTDKPIQKKQPTRKSKLQKYAKGDSPGSVERKQLNAQAAAETGSNPQTGAKSTSPRYFAVPRSPLSSKRSSNLKSRSSPCLKMKKSRPDLRSANADDDVSEAPKLSDVQQPKSPQRFYLQNQHQLNPEVDTSAVIVSPGKGWGYNGEENIPPVPPVPKDLIESAVKVDPNFIRGLESIKESDLSPGNQQPRSLCQDAHVKQKVSDNFEWPEDIF